MGQLVRVEQGEAGHAPALALPPAGQNVVQQILARTPNSAATQHLLRSVQVFNSFVSPKPLLTYLVSAVLLSVVPDFCVAQEFPDYRLDVGVFGGGSWYSAMVDDEHLGEGSDDVRYRAGWVTGLQATWWPTRRFGPSI